MRSQRAAGTGRPSTEHGCRGEQAHHVVALEVAVGEARAGRAARARARSRRACAPPRRCAGCRRRRAARARGARTARARRRGSPCARAARRRAPRRSPGGPPRAPRRRGPTPTRRAVAAGSATPTVGHRRPRDARAPARTGASARARPGESGDDGDRHAFAERAQRARRRVRTAPGGGGAPRRRGRRAAASRRRRASTAASIRSRSSYHSGASAARARRRDAHDVGGPPPRAHERVERGVVDGRQLAVGVDERGLGRGVFGDRAEDARCRRQHRRAPPRRAPGWTPGAGARPRGGAHPAARPAGTR